MKHRVFKHIEGERSGNLPPYTKAFPEAGDKVWVQDRLGWAQGSISLMRGEVWFIHALLLQRLSRPGNRPSSPWVLESPLTQTLQGGD